LQAVFREVLGWDSRSGESEIFTLTDTSITGTKVASLLRGVVVFQFDFPTVDSVSPSLQNELSKAVGKRYVERLLVFKTKETSTWLWPKRTASGALTHEKFSAPNHSMPLFLAQRLAALRHSSTDALNGLTIATLREKLRGSFDTSNVTKKFFDKFKSQHESLAKAISGLEENQAASYATLLLNRLMFIYFLQKKEFLNGDPDYLQTCLLRIKAAGSNNRFFNFYQDLLRVLFFDVLNEPNRKGIDPEVAKIIGDIPYINGGLFSEIPLEREFTISIPDEAFASVFKFFDSFTWHLDTRPTGNSDEINPEVIGYIFEQYINYTAGGKKMNGAYYTKADVTGYIANQTLVLRMIDCLIESGLQPLQLLPTSKTRFISEAARHGWDYDRNTWTEVDSELQNCWFGNPNQWGTLDQHPIDDSVCLPGESWVEMFHRRDLVTRAIENMAAGGISSVNDLVTQNLNSQLLLQDAILAIDNDQDLEKIWNQIVALTVIDPTCGSGAFLFAALEILELAYSALLDVAEELAPSGGFAHSLCQEIDGHPNRRYFIRKKAALNNLYGTDLMADAIETAKLRVFLALASCLDNRNDIEPLPDLDFNFKVGNLLVGIKDLDDLGRIAASDLTARLTLVDLEPKLNDYVASYSKFVHDSTQISGVQEIEKVKLKNKNAAITKLCDDALVALSFISAEKASSWLQEVKPLHWFAEFPQVFLNGGFDVVIGNPPYIRARDLSDGDKNSLVGYATLPVKDLYEVCFERSLQLLSPEGRHGMIVMSSIARGDDFQILRTLISNESRSEWWSTYSIRPASLFTGIKVRNAIVLLGPRGSREVNCTRNLVFTSQTRKWLFDTMEYVKITRVAGATPLRGGIANGLALALDAAKKAESLRTQRKIYLRNSGKYWYPVLLGPSTIFDSDLNPIGEDLVAKRAQLFDFENEANSISLCAGKLGFFTWSITGDDFNVSESHTVELRRTLFDKALQDQLTPYSAKVLERGLNSVILSEYRGSLYPNVNWASARKATDQFDEKS
jgi:type I restriction-modification system DNA methylase subunit